MIGVCVAGVSGQMGRTLVQLIDAASDLQLCGAFESSGHSAIGQDAGLLAGVAAAGVTVSSSETLCPTENCCSNAKPSVLIDFTTARATVPIATQAIEQGCGVVIGTTGHTPEELAAIHSLGDKGAVLMSPNMSVGVNVTFKLVEMATQWLDAETDIEIYEMHHKHKVDSPSGTAVRLGEVVAGARDQKLDSVALHGRQGHTGERVPGSIGFHSARGGDVVGDHTVTFASTGERIEISHKAQSRANFGNGALRATRYVAEQVRAGRSGMFSMDQVLGLA